MSKIKKHKVSSRFPTGPLIIGEDKIKEGTLTSDQEKAEKLFQKWFKSKKGPDEQILRIGGQSGTGKSFLLRYIIEKYKFTADNCYVMAYTGQAVNVLRSNGILANTIHSTIMIPIERPIISKETGKPIFRHGVPLMETTFRPVKSIPSDVELLIIDEASFLPETLENILKRYNTPILEIGDPIQLPPVADKQVFMMDSLSYFMQGIMRQKADSEIIDLATKLRLHQNIDTRKYHDEVLFLYAQPTIEETFNRFLPFFKSADMILTCTNKQRQAITDLYRRKILKTDSPYPIAGERMICRHNNRSLMLDKYILTNGTQGRCVNNVGHSMIDKTTHTYYMDFQPDVVADTDLFYDNLLCDTLYLKQPFGTSDPLIYKRPGEKFEYAHAITTHLAQGAECDTVLYMDAFSPDIDYLARIRYTAATRARKRLIYILPYTEYPGWNDLRTFGERN